MKNYEAFYELQQQYTERLKELEAAMNAVQFPDIVARRINPEAYHAAAEAAMNAYKPLDEEAHILRIALKVNADNMKQAMFERVKNAAYEVFSKYDGKPYGEKTADKIRAAMIEKYSAYFAISTRYYNCGNHITLQVLNPDTGYYNDVFRGQDMTVYESNNSPIIDDNNKIHAANIEKLYIGSRNEYAPDPLERARDIIAAAERVNAKIAELNNLQETYNALKATCMKSAVTVYELRV